MAARKRNITLLHREMSYSLVLVLSQAAELSEEGLNIRNRTYLCSQYLWRMDTRRKLDNPLLLNEQLTGPIMEG